MNAPDNILLPPHSIEAEQSLIGGLLLDKSAWDRIAEVVSESDFYRDDHRRIFRQIALLASSGKDVDVITVFEGIERTNQVDQTGGLAYLGEIANATPSAANIRRYAEIVREKAKLRRAISIADDFQAACFRPGRLGIENIVADAEAKFAELLDAQTSEPASIADAFNEALCYIDTRGETGGLRRRLVRLEQEARSAPGAPSQHIEATLKQPGVMARIEHIAEHGASPNDLEWLDDHTKATGFNFREVVMACVKFNEEY